MFLVKPLAWGQTSISFCNGIILTKKRFVKFFENTFLCNITTSFSHFSISKYFMPMKDLFFTILWKFICVKQKKLQTVTNVLYFSVLATNAAFFCIWNNMPANLLLSVFLNLFKNKKQASACSLYIIYTILYYALNNDFAKPFSLSRK